MHFWKSSRLRGPFSSFTSSDVQCLGRQRLVSLFRANQSAAQLGIMTFVPSESSGSMALGGQPNRTRCSYEIIITTWGLGDIVIAMVVSDKEASVLQLPQNSIVASNSSCPIFYRILQTLQLVSVLIRIYLPFRISTMINSLAQPSQKPFPQPSIQELKPKLNLPELKVNAPSPKSAQPQT
jgi:hypothetical protein